MIKLKNTEDCNQGVLRPLSAGDPATLTPPPSDRNPATQPPLPQTEKNPKISSA